MARLRCSPRSVARLKSPVARGGLFRAGWGVAFGAVDELPLVGACGVVVAHHASAPEKRRMGRARFFPGEEGNKFVPQICEASAVGQILHAVAV